MKNFNIDLEERDDLFQIDRKKDNLYFRLVDPINYLFCS
jgi:hypothetical protein